MRGGGTLKISSLLKLSIISKYLFVKKTLNIYTKYVSLFFFERMLSYHIITSFKKNCFTLFCVADFVLHVKKRRENLQYLLVFICSAKSVGRGTIFKNPIVSLVLGTQVANIVLNIHCCQALNLNNVMKTKN